MKDRMENTMKNIIKGIGISLLSTMILLLIFSIILSYTDVSESTITPVILVVTAISILFGSSIVNIKIKKNGIVNGGIIGSGYIILLYFTSSILNWNFSLNIRKYNNDICWNYIWHNRRNNRSK